MCFMYVWTGTTCSMGCEVKECNPSSAFGCNVCSKCCNSSIPIGGGPQCESCVQEQCCIPASTITDEPIATTVTVLLADAKPVWTFQGGSPIPLSPAISADGGLVFAAVESSGVVGFGGTSANVIALNASSGELVWSFNVPGAGCLTCPSDGFTAPTLSGDGLSVFAGSADSKLYKLNATTGDLLWVGNTSSDVYSGTLEATPSLSVSGGTVFVGSDSGQLYALNASSGENNWNFATSKSYSPAQILGTSIPGPDGDSLFLATTGGEVFKLNIALGPV